MHMHFSLVCLVLLGFALGTAFNEILNIQATILHHPSALLLPDNHHIAPSKNTHWCVISKLTATRTAGRYFYHFPHACEMILPCWSYFLNNAAESNCGFLLFDGLDFGKAANSWQSQLVKKMGCRVKTIPQPLTLGGSFPIGLNEIYHIPNLALLKPRFNRQVYLTSPSHATSLRRLLIKDDEIIDAGQGEGKPLQIGLIQRGKGRIITNISEIRDGIQLALPDATINVTTLALPNLYDQALWFATKNVIIGAHGAALTNSVFVTPGTFVYQFYPKNYFWQSLDPLIEQSGGIALDWYAGVEPDLEWKAARRRGEQNKWRDVDITADVEEVVGTIMRALGREVATVKNVKSLP